MLKVELKDLTKDTNKKSSVSEQRLKGKTTFLPETPFNASEQDKNKFIKLIKVIARLYKVGYNYL